MTLVLSERDGPIALLTLNRPDQLNALSSALEEELAAAIASPQVREASALIIRGAGERAFSAGADTTELDVATPESALAYYEYTGNVYEQLARLAVPSIAQIHGWCVGGGLELALACDLRVADASSRFWFPEVERGILPSSGGTARAVRALGPAVARRLILLGEKIDAPQALALGVIHEVVPDGQAGSHGAGLGADAGLALAPGRAGRAPGDRRRRRRLARGGAGGRAPRLRGARRIGVSGRPTSSWSAAASSASPSRPRARAAGCAVTLCESGGLAQAASGRNQGLVIGPNPPAMEAIGRVTLELLLDLHERSGAAFAFDREPYGCLMLGDEEGGELLDGAALREAEPLLSEAAECGWLNLNARRIDPGAAAAALADDARACGRRDPHRLRRARAAAPGRRRDGRADRRRPHRGRARGRGGRPVVVARLPLAARATCRCAACAAGSSSRVLRPSGCAT